MMARSSSLKTKLLALGLHLAWWRAPRSLVSLFFRHMDHFLSADRLYQNNYWVAFAHPQLVHALHLLIVPLKAVPSLQGPSLTPPNAMPRFSLRFRSGIGA
ncbi:MAG: hypothetical protein SVR81_06070 [Chloroflexota bacterium]|nr:hypothetical protein [Chloroflexota bacterium]